MTRQKAIAWTGLITLALLVTAAVPVVGEATPLPKEAPELLTDRPDFTETSFVVSQRSVQIESGFTYTTGPDGDRVFNAPELLLRYGVTARTELRLGLPDYRHVRGGGQRAQQFGDTYLGFKHQFLASGGRNGLGLIPAVTLPTGGSQLTSGRVDPEIVLAWSRELSAAWSVGGIFGLSWPSEEGERNRTFFPTVSFGRTLSDHWGTFFEWAAEFTQRGGDIHLLHHGYTYALTSVSQADVHLGFGLSAAAPNFFIGGGYAVRY